MVRVRVKVGPVECIMFHYLCCILFVLLVLSQLCLFANELIPLSLYPSLFKLEFQFYLKYIPLCRVVPRAVHTF